MLGIDELNKQIEIMNALKEKDLIIGTFIGGYDIKIVSELNRIVKIIGKEEAIEAAFTSILNDQELNGIVEGLKMRLDDNGITY